MSWSHSRQRSSGTTPNNGQADTAGLNRNTSRRSPLSGQSRPLLAGGIDAAGAAHPNPGQPAPTGESRRWDDRCALNIPAPRTAPHHDKVDIQFTGGTKRLSPNLAVTDDMACVYAGSAGSIDNPFELQWHRPVRIPQLRPMIARQNVQRHELRTFTRSDCDRSVHRCSIRRPSIGREQHDARRSVKPRPRRRTCDRSSKIGMGHANHGPRTVTAAVVRFGPSQAGRTARREHRASESAHARPVRAMCSQLRAEAD